MEKEEPVRTRPPRVLGLMAAALFVASACSSATPSVAPTPRNTFNPATLPPVVQQTFHIPAFDPVALRWFCCLGAGDAPEQQPGEKAAAAGFATKYPGSSLKLEVSVYDAAVDLLSTQIKPNPPDIAGPVGIGGLATFKGQWTDLTPYLTESVYDMAAYDPTTVEFFKQDGAQIGVPFDLYPSMLWYKRDFFQEAGLNDPPHQFGAKYKMKDGTEVEWNYDTLRQIAMKLTVDKAGKDATQAGFNPNRIEQWGFEPQRDVLQGMGAFWGAGTLVGGDGKTVVIPDAWKAGWKFVYDGVWKDHFIMNEALENAPEFGNGNPYQSGHVAMALTHLWYTCCVSPQDDAGNPIGEPNWDLAAVPSYQGTTTSNFNADTFRIWADTKHPQESFEVLTYLLGDASQTLLGLYGGMPARSADQDQFFTNLDDKWTQGVDWQVAKDSVQYADNPSFEGYTPAYQETFDAIVAELSKFRSTEGINMDDEIAKFKDQLQEIYDRAQ
jgi:multiple sugar transport system substrate-binding protein